jgi:hypothetical protein
LVFHMIKKFEVSIACFHVRLNKREQKRIKKLSLQIQLSCQYKTPLQSQQSFCLTILQKNLFFQLKIWLHSQLNANKSHKFSNKNFFIFWNIS